MTVRDIDQEWNQVLDDLHSEYRKRGGKITLIMGDNALRSYLSVTQKEGVTVRSLKFQKATGYSVFVERSRVVPIGSHTNTLLRANPRSFA